MNRDYHIDTGDWLKTLRENVKTQSTEMREKYLEARNSRNTRAEGSLNVGDWVLIRKHDFSSEIPNKLQRRREGPLVVETIEGTEIGLRFLTDF